MTLEEKIGQLQMVDASGDSIPHWLEEAVRAGRVGAVINQVDPARSAHLQDLARQSRLGVPLLNARDVIHGFKTVFPIPLGQAATWNPDLVKQAARASAVEAASHGVNWTFSPMLDISRDPRWGRIAESFGEDTYLTCQMGVAMVEGYQGDDLADPTSIAACVKHFAGYGASEGGRDYSAANIPDNELRNVYLPPFWNAIKAGAASLMPSFSDIDGLPATANDALMLQILRDYWEFDGLVVSDWDAIGELTVHGLAGTYHEAALLAAKCRVDMEMSSTTYADHLQGLVASGAISEAEVDMLTRAVLRMKQRLGLLDGRRPTSSSTAQTGPLPADLDLAQAVARESVVLLQNMDNALPLDPSALRSVAVVGPLADAPHDQMGTWVFDGDAARSKTPLAALKKALGETAQIHFTDALKTSRDRSHAGFAAAVDAAHASDVIVAFLGEESILSGEAHCRADITLPGAQLDLLRALKVTEKPVITVILAGRPLALKEVLAESDAVLFAWHGGSMAGPAICDLLLGLASPSGRLPVTFPKSVGQVPIYYNHKRSGRPTDGEHAGEMVLIDDIDAGAPQTSLGMTAFYLDEGDKPLFPFGYGLTYSDIQYGAPNLNQETLNAHGTMVASAMVRNVGAVRVTETVQLYIRDHVGSLTRPIRELKGFQRVDLEPGEEKTVTFTICVADLSFSRRDKSWGAEPGWFSVWIAPDAQSGTPAGFELIDA
jgi:beta-glucosidase